MFTLYNRFIPIMMALVLALILISCAEDDKSSDADTDTATASDSNDGDSDSRTGSFDGDSASDSGTDTNDTATQSNDTDWGNGDTGIVDTTYDTSLPDYCLPTQGWDEAYAEKELALIALVNEHRAQGAECGSKGSFGPADPLTRHTGLECAARMHSMDMVTRNFFDHDNPDGDGPKVRIEAAGVTSFGWGENIAGGNESPKDTIAQWMASDGHCANFMNPKFTHIGMGYYPGGEWLHYWTATLISGQ
ncbi:MAG: CAP domain-containing protein [Deltaproteobacteria bacterium]|nr:CAP domain-containing protein [Deltaproteobacteria bacterium]